MMVKRLISHKMNNLKIKSNTNHCVDIYLPKGYDSFKDFIL